MKRDWDVIRDVLTQIEEMPSKDRENLTVVLRRNEADDEKRAFAEHIWLLYDAGFLTASEGGSFEGRTLLSPNLTWEGHDLLATIRSKPVWERIKATASEKGIELTVDAVKALAKVALEWVVGN